MKFVHQVIILAIVATMILALGACSPSTPPAPAATAIPSPVPAATVVSASAPTATPLPPTPAPTLAATATRTAVPPTVTWTSTPSPKSMLVAAFNAALGKLKTYRATVLEENRDIDVILPDRFAQNGFDPIVKIGGMLYTYDARGNLRAGPASSVPFFDRGEYSLAAGSLCRIAPGDFAGSRNNRGYAVHWLLWLFCSDEGHAAQDAGGYAGGWADDTAGQDLVCDERWLSRVESKWARQPRSRLLFSISMHRYLRLNRCSEVVSHHREIFVSTKRLCSLCLRGCAVSGRIISKNS
jgi:hypothetical protein